MQVSAGSRLGPYEIVSRLGAGGMGEVFKARDTRLDRSVAVKILPVEFAQDPQLKLRFEREAKTISQLNHPNICTLYDVGDGYLVMELLEGESLADRLTRGPLLPHEVLKYGAQIAEALDRAHRQGVIHRDVKPGNIMLTKSGAKLLDFGLAKGTTKLADNEATQQKPLTQEGTILGTFQYMAPEQLEGTEADARTDIFALGALLYESATGQRAFKGKNKTSLIAAIVGGEPRPMRELQPLTPPGLEHVIAKCLEKDPEDRWQSAHDIAEELKWIGAAGSQAGVAAPVAMRRRTRERLAWALSLLILLIALAATWSYFILRRAPARVIESAIVTPPNHRLSVENGAAVISPDGALFVLVLEDKNYNRSLWLRPIESEAYRQLAGTDGALFPFWSPDSHRIGFFADGQMKSVQIEGGAVRAICNAPLSRGAAWISSGTIVFAAVSTGPLMKVSASGGKPSPATVLGRGEISHRYPSFLPGGTHFLFLAQAGKPEDNALMAGSLEDPAATRMLMKSSMPAIYAAPGHLLYWRDNAIVAQPFDARRRVIEGDAIPIAEGAAVARGVGIFSASGEGTLLFQRGAGWVRTRLVWVDRTGMEEAALTPPGLYFSPALSHDQRRIAVDASEENSGSGDIWIFDLERNVSSRLTYDSANESAPVWSHDDRRVIFFSDKNGVRKLYQIPSGGTGQDELLVETEKSHPTDVSEDGKWIVFWSDAGSASVDIWIYSTAEKKSRPWLATPFSEAAAVLSSDSRWIAYESDESGRNEVYVRSFPESDQKWLISNDGGSTPSWRGDGREIYYVSNDRRMMAVPITMNPQFAAGPPVPLFEANLRASYGSRQYGVSRDGARFLLSRVSDAARTEPLALVQNWPARTRRMTNEE